MTAVRPSTATPRTNPRSTMLTPRSGSMTSASASRTAAASAVGSAGRAGVTGSAGAGPVGPAGRAVACSPAGRSTMRTRQVGLWIQSATPWALRRTRTMSSPASALPSATTSSRGSRPAASARTIAPSSSRAIASQVRPGPNRSRARAGMTGWPVTARSAARASPSVTRSCGSSTCHSAASVVPMRGPLSGRGDGRGGEPLERQRLVAELAGGGAVVAGDQAAGVEHVLGAVQRDHRAHPVTVQAERGKAALLERAADDEPAGAVGLRDQARAGDGVLELIGPEPVDVAERLALAEHVAGRDAPVPEGGVVVLDPDAAPVSGQVLGGDVPDGVDAGGGRGEALVHLDAVAGRQAGLLGELGAGHGADADDEDVGVDVAGRGADPHPAAEHRDVPGRGHPLAQRGSVLAGPQVADAVAVQAGQDARPDSGGEQQLVVAEDRAAGQGDGPGRQVELGGPRAEEQLDRCLLIPGGVL